MIYLTLNLLHLCIRGIRKQPPANLSPLYIYIYEIRIYSIPNGSGDGRGSSASNSGYMQDKVDGNRNASVCSTTSKPSFSGDTPVNPGSYPSSQLESPCSVASDASLNWNGIPRVRRKWVDVIEGRMVYMIQKLQPYLCYTCVNIYLITTYFHSM